MASRITMRRTFSMVYGRCLGLAGARSLVSVQSVSAATHSARALYQASFGTSASARADAASSSSESRTEPELRMEEILSKALDIEAMRVRDISGGCGSMYHVAVVSPQFEGINLVKYQRLVKEALRDEIKDMHGITIVTMTPEKFRKQQQEQEGRQ